MPGSAGGPSLGASALFAAYAACMAVTAAVSASLLLSSSATPSRSSPRPASPSPEAVPSPMPLHLVSLASSCLVSSGLVYENGLVAVAFFLKHGPLLKRLSFGRFYLHLTAPLATFSGMDIAMRAGVGWASNNVTLVAFAAITAILMGFAAWHLLSHELRLYPVTEHGLVMYTSTAGKQKRDPMSLLAMLLPVVWLSLAMVALGLGVAWRYRADMLVSPVAAAGPLLCFLLCSQAARSKWMENLGEVILLGSIVYLQAQFQ